MGKKKRNITIKQGLDGWVMTYGDMMSLLLTFFVLIVSFSSMQESKFEQAAQSLKDAFGVMAQPESVIDFNDPLIPSHNPDSEEAELLYEVRAVEKVILDEGLDQQVEIEVQEDGVLFRLEAPFLFKSGGAELAQEPRNLLGEISNFFTRYPYQIRVEGHTDSLPINSPRFPSNWELSAARAVTVARYFQGLGVEPQRIAATGFGEFRPLTTNTTREGRARNRRVEIFLALDRQDLPRDRKLPLAPPVPLRRMGAVDEKTMVPENVSPRPIINPVTGKLGVLPINK